MKARLKIMQGRTACGLVPLVMFMAAQAGAVEIANVNGKGISDSDLITALAGMNEGQRKAFLRDPSNRKEAIQGLIEQELVIQEGEKAKLDQEPEYQKALGQFRKQYLAARMMERSLSSKMTEAGAKKWYQAHKSEYSTDRAVAQHILASSEAEAQDVLKKASADGADFQDLAEKLSKDPSAKNNRGDIGVVTRESPFDPAFKEAVFRTESGKVTGPVKTAFGYHVIKVTERNVGRILDFAEVELRVKNDFRTALVREWVSKLRSGAKIKVDEAALNKF
jgi:peptidyl-prolyl cis-trans isomerase C